MYNYLIKNCKKDCDSQHTNKPTENGMRHESDYDKQGYEICILGCDTTFKPLKHYDVEHATANGWYIFSTLHSEGSVYYYLAHKIMTKDNLNALNHASGLPPTLYRITTKMDINLMDKKLDKLPDLQKTYETGRWYQRKQIWKLIYNEVARLFEWTNQTDDKEIPQPFLIASPLKIGDKIATEVK
jgi:hypothetical protein